MRFEFFHERFVDVDKVSVDGIVPGVGLHLSHWDGNRTPASLKADTSTEIALRFVAAPDRVELARGAELATNNHFDTDGTLSVWTVVEGERALERAALLAGAAAAGDFSAFAARDALKVSLAIQGDAEGSPLAAHVGGAPVTDDAECYRLVLPLIGDLLARPDAFESLWREGLARIDAAMESFAAGRSTVEEDAGRLVSLVLLAPDAAGTERIDPTRHTPPFTAISHHTAGRLLLVATEGRDGGWSYRVDWPYWSWAETVVRPRIERIDLAPAAARLSAHEPAGAAWRVDDGELSSALKVDATSRLEPAVVAAELRAALRP